jgi:hypothetical protein
MLLAAHSVVKALSSDAFFSLKARLRPPVAALPCARPTDAPAKPYRKVRGNEDGNAYALTEKAFPVYLWTFFFSIFKLDANGRE